MVWSCFSRLISILLESENSSGIRVQCVIHMQRYHFFDPLKKLAIENCNRQMLKFSGSIVASVL